MVKAGDPGSEDRPAPRRSARGQKKAADKYDRQAAALRANLKRRQQQRRAAEDRAKDGVPSDAE